VRHIVIANRGSQRVRIDATLENLLATTKLEQSSMGDESTYDPVPSAPAADTAPSELTDEQLLCALQANDWKIGATADALGIARSSLYRLIDKSTRIRKAKDVPPDEIRAVRQDCEGDIRKMAAQLEVSPRGLRLRMKELGLS